MNNEDIFLTLAEKLPHIVWYTQPNGEVEYFNQQWYDYTGLTFEQSKNNGWTKALHPLDYEYTLRLWKNALKAGTFLETEYRLRKRNETYEWFLVRTTPVFDKDGTIKLWFGTCTNIHDRKKARDVLIQREQQLLQSNELMDNFVRIASHDLQGPLWSMKSLLTIYKNSTDPDKKEQIVDMIDLSVDRMRETLGSLKSLLRWKDEEKAEPKNMLFAQLLEQIKKDLSEWLHIEDVEIYDDFSKVEQIVYIEPYLVSIKRNLLSNAIKYRSPQRGCRISVLTDTWDEGVLLSVSDNGIGIDLENKSHLLFQSFKRLTNQGGGTGLGLHLIKQMVEHNGGKIEVESKLDQGTTFRLYLKEYT